MFYKFELMNYALLVNEYEWMSEWNKTLKAKTITTSLVCIKYGVG